MLYADHMFSGAASYNGIGIENWDTSSLTSANGMFEETHMFTGKVGMWNVSSCENFGKSKSIVLVGANLHTELSIVLVGANLHTELSTDAFGTRYCFDDIRKYVLYEQFIQ